MCLGGVGSFSVEALVRSGIENIIIVDYDTIDITNLNRQVMTNVSNIGKKAVDNKDGMVILFGEGANKDLEDVSVIQKFSTETPVSGFVFKKGDTITVDGQTYVANYVGPMVESNMKALGHATLFFNRPVSKTP